MREIFKLITQYINIKGIIQAGANVGQECNLFKAYTQNIVCFEPVPNVYNILKRDHPTVESHNLALGDKNEKLKMYVASNNGESSSFLKPLNHLKYYNITFNEEIESEIVRFDSLDYNMDNYNVIVSDTQGYEVKVLSGFGDRLKFIDSVIIEFINSELYEGDASLEDITKFLTDFNFELIHTTPVNNGAGVAVYIKK